MTTQVPFLDLKIHHEPVREEICAAIMEVISKSAFAGGPYVAAFEKDFAAYCGAKYAIGCGNGTDALWIALIGLGVKTGDEVITVPATFMATAEAISYSGAKPVFVDIDPTTYNMDPAQLEKAITPRTKAIIPVHLMGQTADMAPILSIAARHGIPVVEDACQAHGAEYKGQKAGTLGAAGCFSFYPGKNLGAWGEAGAVITNDASLCEKMMVFRDHGQAKKYHHSMVVWNARMDGIQGAVLKVKLKHLDYYNNGRRSRAALYKQLLSDVEQICLPTEASYGKHIYHIYAIRTQKRDALMKELGARGIGCGIHYPIPVHLQDAYAFLGYKKGSFPVAERCASEFLSLPMFPELTDEQVQQVARELKTSLEFIGKENAVLA
jgi:dTDP-4-amino-4,6-dideoxygalactose transaminase